MSDSYFIAKLVVIIVGLIITIILAYFKSRSEAKKTKGIFVVTENNDTVHSNPSPSL